jgi:nucleoside-diphosphate-sugar epimerase
MLEDASKWQSVLNSVDCVVHLAARVHQFGAAGRDEQAFFEVNVRGAGFVAEQAGIAGVRRFILMSSIKVNGDGDEVGAYSAKDTPKPQDYYARSKLAAEMAVGEESLRHKIQLVIVRPPLVYGPGVAGNFRRLMRLVELGVPLPFLSIDNRRSYVSTPNLCDFVETCMCHPNAAGRTWLISDGNDLSTPELLRMLARKMSRRVSLIAFPSSWLRIIGKLFGRAEEMARLTGSLRLDISPAIDQLGWRPCISVDEGLAQTVAAYNSDK